MELGNTCSKKFSSAALPDINNNIDYKAVNHTTDNVSLYQKLICEAAYLPLHTEGEVPLQERLEDIPWLDKTLIRDGISFYFRYYTASVISNLLFTIVGLALKPVSSVLLQTGRFCNPQQSFKRYLSTVKRSQEFVLLLVGFWEGETYRVLDKVRKMHFLAGKTWTRKVVSTEEPEKVSSCVNPEDHELVNAIRKDLQFLDDPPASLDFNRVLSWKPTIPVSQFDMVMIQYSVWGGLWVLPELFGIHGRNEEMKGILHIWAIVGRLLGLKDEYNICINPDPKVYDDLFRNVVLTTLKTMDATVIAMQKDFVEGFKNKIPFITHKSVIYFALQNVDGYKGDNLKALMDWKDKIYVRIVLSGLWLVRSCFVIRLLINLFFICWMKILFLWHLQ